MARILYKKGLENQNRLECIEGIEIEMSNGQCALIYPKYAELTLLDYSRIGNWDAKALTLIKALKVENCTETMDELLEIESPAANYTHQFKSDVHGAFGIPTLFVATEIEYHMEEINDAAKTIEGADLINEFYTSIWSCIRSEWDYAWIVSTYYGTVRRSNLNCPCTCIPTVVYKKQQTVYMVTSERGTQEDMNNLVDETKIFENLDNAKTYAKRKFEDVLKMFGATKDDVNVEESGKEKEEEYSIHAKFLHRYTEWDVWVLIQKKEIE